ncbi:MAG: hypothetical protein SPD80_02860 [Atopobium sp.]|uniref:helix-turn-helix domain-containing protein n=1 Tax=Atopobium sp. TaxID=1872650 RepID=UPI002A83C47B|nr:hypothetical protein [Atopobium sp.]MDY4522520.1 hypothetical protein [Atopobium sp.]
MSTNRPNRSKAEFRALRETLGLTDARLADLAGVQERSVRRWATPSDTGYRAPADVWELLDDMREQMQAAIDVALDIVEQQTEEYGAARAIQLPYWFSAVDYRQHHYTDDGRDWRFANACSRAVAIALETQGYEVEFVDGKDNTVLKQV